MNGKLHQHSQTLLTSLSREIKEKAIFVLTCEEQWTCNSLHPLSPQYRWHWCLIWSGNKTHSHIKVRKNTLLSLIGISQNVEMSYHWCVTNSKHLSFSETLLFLWSHACTTHSKILLVVWRECQEEDSSPLLHGDKHWQEKKKCICETLAR